MISTSHALDSRLRGNAGQWGHENAIIRCEASIYPDLEPNFIGNVESVRNV
jgi:hypothetical protein